MVISCENLHAFLHAKQTWWGLPRLPFIPVLIAFLFFLLAICFTFFSSVSIVLIDLHFSYRIIMGTCAGIAVTADHHLYCEPLCLHCISIITGAFTNQLQWLKISPSDYFSMCQYFMVAADGQSERICSWCFSVW
jgi:hypothetical protein